VSETRIVIAAGGTAGHVAPALAVAGALRAEGAAVSFVGGTRAEAQLVPAAGYPLRTLSVEGLSRSNPLRAARALARAALALARARAILRELAPAGVLGGGGYVSGPVGLAAVSLGIPLVITEADSHLGLANRLLARRARRVCLAFPIAGREGPRYRVTGRPIPFADAERESAREHFGLEPAERCVLVFGGSLGARSINLAAVAGLAGLVEGSRGGLQGGLQGGPQGGVPVRVLHVAGRRDYAELAGRELPVGYDLREYLDLGEFARALAAADLAVARAGGSVFELAAYGLPAILIPYPHASADHQSVNARWMADGGAAVVVADGELTSGQLTGEVGALLDDERRLAAMSAAARALARPGAAADVAGEVLRAAGR
jgi:UDP-N-acetylglucosamine--N-acetylmuramyl-(pentapeptide) pyrophosphoryl-undecaprenol N-acetylglucosamine transferase